MPAASGAVARHSAARTATPAALQVTTRRLLHAPATTRSATAAAAVQSKKKLRSDGLTLDDFIAAKDGGVAGAAEQAAALSSRVQQRQPYEDSAYEPEVIPDNIPNKVSSARRRRICMRAPGAAP
jgi:hypothetical protein